MVAAILVSVALGVLDTEPALSASWLGFFRCTEVFFGVLFAAEYAARFWIAGPDASGSIWRSRLRWALSPAALIDLLAFSPMLFLTGWAPTSLLRLARLLRILRLAKLGRFSRAWSLIAQAVHERRYELLLSLYAALTVMIVSATLLYLVEGRLQPDKFGSIPRALWWSVMTLTTIGYGDVYPQTVVGKALASVTALVGIGLIAAPTGILAAAFSDAFQRRRSQEARRAEGEGG